MKNLYLTLKYLISFFISSSAVNKNLNISDMSLCQDIRKEGFSIQRGVLTKTQCQELREQIDELISKKMYSWSDDLRSDVRIYEAEKLLDLKWLDQKFKFANKLATVFHTNNYVFTDLIARVRYTEGNLGSGGGWHRDSLKPQFKTIVYLSNADVSNGAFEIIGGTHKMLNSIKLILTTSQKLFNRRFSTEFINSNFAKTSPLEGQAGDQLYVNTHAIHRGRPLEAGERYALTRYYFHTDEQKTAFLSSLQK